MGALQLVLRCFGRSRKNDGGDKYIQKGSLLHKQQQRQEQQQSEMTESPESALNKNRGAPLQISLPQIPFASPQPLANPITQVSSTLTGPILPPPSSPPQTTISKVAPMHSDIKRRRSNSNASYETNSSASVHNYDALSKASDTSITSATAADHGGKDTKQGSHINSNNLNIDIKPLREIQSNHQQLVQRKKDSLKPLSTESAGMARSAPSENVNIPSSSSADDSKTQAPQSPLMPPPPVPKKHAKPKNAGVAASSLITQVQRDRDENVDGEFSGSREEEKQYQVTVGPYNTLAAKEAAGLASAQTVREKLYVQPTKSGDCEFSVLPPVSREDSGKICLVLDLDETLVHSSFQKVPNPDFIVAVEIDGTVHQVYVLVRPGVTEFLHKCADLFEVVVFTASLAKYADPVVDYLDPTGKLVRHRLFRESCVHHYMTTYVKDLSVLGRDLKRTIIVDNSPSSYMFHRENALPIQSWFDDPNDEALNEIWETLESLHSVEDVTEHL